MCLIHQILIFSKYRKNGEIYCLQNERTNVTDFEDIVTSYVYHSSMY